MFYGSFNRRLFSIIINVLCALLKALQSVYTKYTAGGESLTKSCVFVTGFEKTQLPHTFRNTEFNYLKYYNSRREADACMKFAMIL